MDIKDVEDLLVYRDRMRLSDHALREAHKESLRARDVFYAIFNGRVLEHYQDRRRVLIVGPLPEQLDLQVHVVCDYTDAKELVAVTVYVPDRPKWVNEVVRGTGASRVRGNPAGPWSMG